jgi:hypothetical protein
LRAVIINPTRDYDRWFVRVNQAFIASLVMWFGFYIGDEIVFRWDLSENHASQGIVAFAAYLAMYILPNQLPMGKSGPADGPAATA